MRCSKYLHLICALALTTNTVRVAVANGLDLSVTARAEAGLDPTTRDFINHLPGTWQPQIATIVNQTLDRADLSFKTYVKEVNGLVSDVLANAKCAIVATEKDVVDDIVKRFPWVNQNGPMQALRSHLLSEKSKRSDHSSPTSLGDLYNDLMLATSLTSCRFDGVPTAKADAKIIFDQLTEEWLVWNRVKTTGCGTALECIESYRKTVKNVIDASDPQDVLKSNGGIEFAALKEPTSPNWLARLWGAKVEFETIENMLRHLYSIENSIGAAQAVREVAAIRELMAGQTETDNAKKQIDAIYSQVVNETALMMRMVAGNKCDFLFDNAKDRLKVPNASLVVAQQHLSTATKSAISIKDNVSAQAKLADDQIKRATVAADFCKG